MNKNINKITKSFANSKFLAAALCFSFLVFQILMQSAEANADENSGYQYDSYKAFYPEFTLEKTQTTIGNDGTIYYAGQSNTSRKICKMLPPAESQCIDITSQTADVPPADGEINSISTDNNGTLFLAIRDSNSGAKEILLQIKTSDLSIKFKTVYTGNPADSPGLIARFDQEISFFSGDRIYYGILSSADQFGSTGPYYLLSTTIGQSDTHITQLRCPLSASNCSQMNMQTGRMLPLANNRRILSFDYTDGGPGFKVWLVLLNGDTIVADQVVDLGDLYNSTSSIKLDSQNRLILEDNKDKLYYYDLGGGTKMDLIKTVTIPSATISSLATDGFGNAFVEFKKNELDSNEVVYKLDENQNGDYLQFAKEYFNFDMFPLPDGCLYFTAHTLNDNTDLVKNCQGGKTEFINSFEFRERLQTHVLYAGSTNQNNGTGQHSSGAYAAYPDAYVFSTNPFTPDFDANDYAILKYKSAPSPTPTPPSPTPPSPTPPGPTPPGPAPQPNPSYPDTGLNLYGFAAVFAILLLSSIALFAKKQTI